ncbi:MAG: hypothetical protein ABSG38_18120 [Spirochaetia bacterium]
MMSELDRQIIHDWLSMLIHQKNDDVAMNDMGIIKACAKAHYQAVHMEEKIRDLRGNLPGFLDFLQSKWGWIVEHDESARTVVADENKPGCVCPLNAEGLMNSPMLCECSCGFADKMFEYVVGKKSESQRCRIRPERWNSLRLQNMLLKVSEHDLEALVALLFEWKRKEQRQSCGNQL